MRQQVFKVHIHPQQLFEKSRFQSFKEEALFTKSQVHSEHVIHYGGTTLSPSLRYDHLEETEPESMSRSSRKHSIQHTDSAILTHSHKNQSGQIHHSSITHLPRSKAGQQRKQSTTRQTYRKQPEVQIDHSLHPMQHRMTLDTDTGTFSYPAKPDWHGSVKPVYYFGYSAFYIDTSLYKNNSVVVVGLVNSCGSPLFCSYHSVTTGEEVVVEGDLHGMPKCLREVSALWCPLPETMIHLPATVNVKLNKSGNSIATVPIEIPKKKPDQQSGPRKYRLLICLKELYLTDQYPNIDTRSFIEWVELNRILGVDHITVYIQNTTKEMLELLTFYTKTGYLDLLSKQPEPGTAGPPNPSALWELMTVCTGTCMPMTGW